MDPFLKFGTNYNFCKFRIQVNESYKFGDFWRSFVLKKDTMEQNYEKVLLGMPSFFKVFFKRW